MPGPWGTAIAQLRAARGWSQAKAATKAHMTATTYGRIERGNHTRTKKLLAIADAFEVPIDDVLVPARGHTRANDFEGYIERKIREGLAEAIRTTGDLAARTDDAILAEVEATEERAERARGKKPRSPRGR